MKFYIVAFLLALLLLSACHSARRINIINRTSDEAEIEWVIKEDSIHRSKLYISNSDTVRFTVHSKPPYNKIKMSFGPGNWTPKELKNFTDDLHYLKMKWNAGFIKLDSTHRILDFLIIRRNGLDNSQINIVLK